MGGGGAAGREYWKGLTQARGAQTHRQTGFQRGANVWERETSGNFHDIKNNNELDFAQKALLCGFFRRQHHVHIPAIVTIGFDEFKRRPEMKFNGAVAELGTPVICNCNLFPGRPHSGTRVARGRWHLARLAVGAIMPFSPFE
jgi:hypothetical protein